MAWLGAMCLDHSDMPWMTPPQGHSVNPLRSARDAPRFGGPERHRPPSASASKTTVVWWPQGYQKTRHMRPAGGKHMDAMQGYVQWM